MIHLPLKQQDQAPARLSVSGALRQIDRAIVHTNGEVYNSSYYPHDEVINLLRAYSIHKTQFDLGDRAKCNYCESQTEHVVKLQVEHYRPKAKVEVGENDHVETLGYYWLGLEWTNLLLSCPKCNGKDAKGNKFPIRGIRAQPHNPVTFNNRIWILTRTNCYANSPQLQREIPILLNPEIDNPELFLTFDEMSNISGFGNDRERGEISKDVYRLNRDELLICRQKVWNEIKNDINTNLFGYHSKVIDEQALRFNFKVIAEKLIKRKLPSEEYTLWGRYLNNNLSTFLNYLDNKSKDLFLQVYNETILQIP